MGAKRPGWYHGWNIVAACVLSQIAALGLTVNSFSLFLHDWSAQFSTPISSLAASMTAFALATAVIAPMIGVMADKYPARWLFGAALAGLAVFHVAMGFMTAGWQIIALYGLILPFVLGFAASIPAQSLVSRWFVRRVGLAMGLSAFGMALAGVILPPIIAKVMPVIGWRWVWWSGAAVIGLVILPVVVLMMRDRPGPKDGLHYVTGGQTHHHAGGQLRARDVLRRPNFWVLIGVFVPVQCVSMGASINLAPIVLSRGFGAGTAGALLSIMSISALAAKLGSGLLADRIGNRVPLVLLGLVAAAGAGILAFAPSMPAFSVALVLIGLGAGIWTMMASAIAAEFGAQGFGRAFGLIAAFSPVGTLAPPIIAKIEESTGTYVSGLLGLAVLALLGAGVGLLLNQPRRRHLTPAEEEAVAEEAITPAA